jgi:hypothetical protein
MARISRRALNYAETGKAGQTVRDKITLALMRLEAGEVLDDEPHVIREQIRPGVWITVEAEDVATLGDLREVEDRIHRLIESYRK